MLYKLHIIYTVPWYELKKGVFIKYNELILIQDFHPRFHLLFPLTFPSFTFLGAKVSRSSAEAGVSSPPQQWLRIEQNRNWGASSPLLPPTAQGRIDAYTSHGQRLVLMLQTPSHFSEIISETQNMKFRSFYAASIILFSFLHCK